MDEKRGEWKKASQSASTLCDLLFATGGLRQALATAEQGKDWAERSGDQFRQMVLQACLAKAHHLLGNLPESRVAFQEAERMQAAMDRDDPRLYALQGKNYCDLLLEQARETAEWEDVIQRAQDSWRIVSKQNHLLSIALDHLTQGRALAALGRGDEARKQFNLAVDTIRRAGFVLYTPEFLLHRATFLRGQGAKEAACQDMEEALEIAVRCGMFPYEADGRLLEGHVLLDEGNLDEAQKATDRADELIKQMEYGQQLAKLYILRSRLLRQKGKDKEANEWETRAEERIEQTGQWSLLSDLELVTFP